MNLIVDVGNTLVKTAVFDSKKIISYQKIPHRDFVNKIKLVFAEYSAIKNAIVSNVGGLPQENIAVLHVFCSVHELSHASKMPFKNYYASPHTLGVDRMALAAAAFYSYPKRNTLIIDAGTCVTYDFISEEGYLGGAISPGIAMRYKAMYEQTSKLPFLEKKAIGDFIGNTTETSMHSGVINGICHEIDGQIGQYKSRFVDLTVILTGGDAQFLSKRLKNTIFAHSNFLLLGLYYLLEYNKR